MERVAAAFPPAPPGDALEFFTLSLQFAEKSGLLTREADRVIRLCLRDRVPASMTMLGNGVFAYGEGAHGVLREFGEVYEFAVAKSGARILGA
jgi:pantoate kinase